MECAACRADFHCRAAFGGLCARGGVGLAPYAFFFASRVPMSQG